MENTPIQLDGAPFEKAVQPLLTSLQELKRLLVAVNSTPTDNLRKEMQALKVSAVTVVAEVETALKKVPGLISKELAQAVKGTKQQMSQAGKEAGKSFSEGMAQTMQAQLKLEQVQYEKLVALRAKFKPGVLENFRARGGNIGPDAKSENFLGAMRANSASRVDPRTLLGLPGRDEMKTLGAQLAAQMREGVSVDGLRAKSAGNIDPRTLLGLEPTRARKSARGSADVFKEGFAEEEKGILGLAKATKLSAAETRLKAKEQYSLADAMNSSHSAARGLASGFGAMWLTWGQIGPLLAGAAISNAAAQSVKLGMKVGQSLAVIQNLGGVAREEMEGLNKVLMETARNGPFGPVEVAKALETLALAGLSAKEQIEALKPTLDFAIAGQMSIEKASGTLIAISTAFGYQARDISVVSDIIAKTAAISMASTEGMAASFKVASVVAQQYNVSLEDVATSLALLAQIGIKDQAAGTAVRQMYSELIGTSAKARKVMKETLNFDVFDEAGKSLKPLPQILTELSAAFSKLNFASQNKALLDMGNERGTKAISAGLKAVQVDLQKAAKDYEAMGLSVEESMTKARETTISNLEKIREEIADAPGFSALAAIGLGASTENQMKSILAALQTSLVEAFQAAEPVITRVALQLQDMFKSEGFRTGVTNLVTGIADLTSALAKNFDLIVVGTAAYFVARTGMTAFAGVTALLSAQAAGLSATLTASGVASGVAAVGITGAGAAAVGASVGFGALALTLLPLTLLAATLGGAYYLLTRKVDENKQSLEDSEAVTARTIKAVEAESERLRLLIEFKGDEAAARGESGRVLQQTTLDEITAAGEARVAALMLASGYLELAKAKEQAYGVFDAMGMSTGTEASSANRVAELDGEIAKIRTLALEKRGETQMIFDRARDRAKEAKEVAEARKKAAAAQGEGKYDGSGSGSTGKKDPQIKAYSDLVASIKEKIAANEEELALGRKLTESEKQVLEVQKLLAKGSISAKDATSAETQALLAKLSLTERLREANAANLELEKVLRDEKYKLVEAMEKANVTGLEQNKTLLEEIEMIGLSNEAQHALTQIRLQDVIAMKEQKLARLENTEFMGREQIALAEEIRLLKEKATLQGQKFDRTAESEKLSELAKQSKQFTDDLHRGLTDSLYRAFESGKGFFRTLWDGIKNLFKTTALKLIVNTIMGGNGPTLGSAAASLMGIGGSNSSSEGGGGGGIMNMASNAKSLYSGISNTYGIGSQVFAGTMSTANALGTVAANATGTGLSGLLATNGAYGTAAGALVATTATTAQAAIAANVAMAAGTAPALAAGTTAAAAGGSVAGAAPLAGMGPVGWIALAAIAAYAAFGGPKERKITTTGVTGTLSASGLSGNSYQNYTQDSGWFGSDKGGQELGALSSAQSNAFTDNFRALRSAATAASTAIGASATILKDYSESIYLEDGADMAAFFAKLGDNMANVAAPGVFAFAKAGETATSTLTRLATALTSVNPVLARLGQVAMQISLMGANSSSKLIDAFGGLDNFSSSTQAFYESYYTEANKFEASQQAVSNVFGALNESVPKTKEEFKRLTQSLNLNTDAGRTAYATLLQLAPTFAAVTEEMSKKAAEAADKLVKSFSSASGVIPALLASDLVLSGLTTTLVSTASAAGYISTLFLDLSSGLIAFGSTQTTTVAGMTNSQSSARKLNQQLTDLRTRADEARIDIAGLNLALKDVDLETFQTVVGRVFENLATRIASVVNNINSERIALREAALDILSPEPMGKAEIYQGILEATALTVGGATSNANLLAAKQVLAAADLVVSQQQTVVEQLRAQQPSTAGVDAASNQLSGANAYLNSSAAGVAQIRSFGNGSLNAYLDAALGGQWLSAPSPSGERNAQNAGFQYRTAAAEVRAYQAVYQAHLADYNAMAAVGAQRVSAAQVVLAQATTQQTAAVKVAREAQLLYVAGLQEFAANASKAAAQLGSLREETVKYYEAQKQLADLMKNSAAGLRSTVDSYRITQMTPEQQFATSQQKFSTAYSMALSTDGSTLVGYADKLNELLNPLLEQAQGIYASEGEYNAFAATMLARAENVALRLDTLAPSNFAQDSLDLLQSLDSALAVLNTATQSTEKIISDAILAGSEKTAAGLRAVIAALTGQPIPAFASGGNFPGGIRLVGENGPELEVTGASKIFNATQTRDIMSGGSSSAVSAALVAEIRGLRQEVSDLRVEARATAVNTGKMARLADRADQDGMLVRTDSDTSLRTTAVI